MMKHLTPENFSESGTDTLRTLTEENRRLREELISARNALEIKIADSSDSEKEFRDKERAAISAVIESEKKYRSLFDSGPNPIFVIDRQTFEIFDANPMAETVYGCTRDELIGRRCTDICVMGEEHRNATPDQMNIFFSNCEENRRIQHYKKGKKPFYVKVKTCPITYKGRKAFILAVTDLTGMMEKEAQLIQANKLNALGEMSAGIAHELNQPLTAIKVGSEFLKMVMEEKQQIDQQDLSEVIHEISGQVDRASQIINRLRAFARKPDFIKKAKERDVNASVRNALAIIAHQLIAENITVRFDSDEDISPVLAPENLLEQVIFNLISNARDALMQKKTADRESVLMIEIRSFQEGNRVAIVISDTGTGIPADIRDKIFDPFFTTKEVGKGMGISLSIVYGIVKDLNGDIEVQTEEGRGTAFKLTFPSAGLPEK